MKLIFRFLNKKDRLLALVIIAVIIVQVLLETHIPSIMSGISNMLQSGTMETGMIGLKAIEMLAFALSAFVIACFASYMISIVGSHVCGGIRKGIFEKVIDFSFSEVSEFGVGTLISRCTDDAAVMQDFMSDCLQLLVQAPVMLVIVIIHIFMVRPIWLGFAGIVIALLVALVIVMFITALPLVSKRSMARDRLATATREHVYGIREIHAGNGYGKQKKAYDEANEDMMHYQLKSNIILSFFSPSVISLVHGLSVAVYISGAYIIQAIDGTPGRIAVFSDMVAFVSYSSLMVSALVNIVTIVLSAPGMMNAQKRILEVLDKEYTIRDGAGAGEETPEKGTVEFRNVCFKYPGSAENALTDISFKIRPGQTTAIIGGTGSGKTSVLNLIPRLYEAGEGEVLVDGINVKEYHMNELRNRIGYVPQSSYLFSGTIMSNIGYGENGRFRATLEEVRKAAETGQADEFIRMKEEGYESKVQSGGTNFSGGQRQRLTISRAICRDPEIYIFDDSFSALDFKTDARLRSALKETTAGASVIIVGQRISTIRDADNIIVMDSGRIVGQGTHEELLRKCDIYREIASSQNLEEAAV
ncbi:MAG: ABC transporter ATP-binding protein [Blautia sp.]|nr:ABC transporter ATP-binding protein [Blautia sp.]